MEKTTKIAGAELPEDSKVMSRIAQREMGRNWCEMKSTRLDMGIPLSVAEFTQKAIGCDHPMAGQAKTSDQLKISVANLFKNVIESWRNHFTKTLSKWKQWAEDNYSKE